MAPYATPCSCIEWSRLDNVKRSPWNQFRSHPLWSFLSGWSPSISIWISRFRISLSPPWLAHGHSCDYTQPGRMKVIKRRMHFRSVWGSLMHPITSFHIKKTTRLIRSTPRDIFVMTVVIISACPFSWHDRARYCYCCCCPRCRHRHSHCLDEPSFVASAVFNAPWSSCASIVQSPISYSSGHGRKACEYCSAMADDVADVIQEILEGS